ncbi:phage tail spike protein [Paenibacillus sp. FSL H8-0034]|uniref:phage tail spike protein n=1 Tax=Paenibacillus sp. FSL H8-0034 TaxID=2954671 RepID=UPI0030F6FABA
MLGYADLPDDVVRPSLQICKNDLSRTVVGNLTEAYNLSQKITLGNINELSFYVPYLIERYHKQSKNPNIENIYNRRIIKFLKGDYTEYYIINKVSDVMEEDQDYKKVECYSLGYELRDKKIKDYKVTSKNASYVLSNLLYDTIWTIDYVSSAFDIKNRSFDITASVLDAIQQVAETFEAVIVYDTVNRKISFYDIDDIGQNKGLSIKYGKLMQNVTYESDGSTYCTRLKAFGRSGLSINRVNPTGSNFVEDYSSLLYGFQRDTSGNVISHAKDISDSLANAILNYSELVTAQIPTFNTLLANFDSYTANLSTQNTIMSTLMTELAVIEDSISIANSTNASPAAIITQKNAKLAQIASQQAVIDGVNSQLSNVDSQITTLRSSISLANNFTQDQLNEWNPWIIVDEFSNENYTDAKQLYDAAKKELEKRREPRISASVGIVNFLEILTEYKNWGKLVLGDIVQIEHEKLGVNITAKIVELSFNYESGDVQVTISNVKDILTDEQKMIQSLYKAITSSATYERNKYELDDTVTTNSEIYQTINNIWDSTERGIVASNNNTVTIDRKGIRITDPTDPLKVLIAQNGVLAISADGGNHWKQALRYDGLVAENVRGILGEFVTLYANQISVSPSGQKIPNEVIASANYWNSIESSANDTTAAALAAAKAYSDTNLITANTFSTNINTAIRNDLRLQAPLPTSVTLNANGITASTTDVNKFARLDYRGLYVQNGALQITSNTGTAIVDGDGITAATIKAGTMFGVESTIGTGNNVFKASSQGIQLGHSVFGSSPFRVDMSGYLYATNATVKGSIDCDSLKIAGVNVLANGGTKISGDYIDKITTNQLVAGTAKIGTALIDDLVVGGNVTMGPNATLAWGRVTNIPSGVYNPAYITETKITSTTIESPNIIGGSITSKTDINVDNDINLGNYIKLKNLNGGSQGIEFAGNASITFKSSGILEIGAREGISMSAVTNFTQMPKINARNIATEDYVNAKTFVATFG